MGAQLSIILLLIELLIPENQQQFFTEKIVLCPTAIRLTTASVRLPMSTLTRAEIGTATAGLRVLLLQQ